MIMIMMYVHVYIVKNVKRWNLEYQAKALFQ